MNNCTILSNGKELQFTCKNEEEKSIMTIKQRILGELESLIYQGYYEFWLNCEYGVPMWTAEMLCNIMKKYYDVKLHIAVPYEEQSCNWNEEQRDRYFRIHEQADSVVFVNRQYHSECYHDAEQYMLERSKLLCLFGSPADNLHAVKMAESLGKEVIFIE